MPDAIQWRTLDAVVNAAPRTPDDVFLARYREAAFRGEAPWRDPDVHLSSRTRRVLLADMARHAATVDDVVATFRAMDDALLSRGQAWVTADAGDILVERSRRHQLPDGWADRVTAIAGDRPSGRYWARAALRAGGHRIAEPAGHAELG